MNRRPLIAGNWKMHKLPSEAVPWLEQFHAKLGTGPHEHADILLNVPYTHLPGMAPIAAAGPVGLGAQDVSAHREGAYTGEVSAAMLRDVGADYVIVGHSERRQYHHEDDTLVRAKVQAARSEGLRPILCIGEREAERDAGRAEEVVLGQLRAALDGITPSAPDGAEPEVVIAYEPVWAIGTGRTATAGDAQQMCAAIRAALRQAHGEVAERLRILYGGSMKPGNAAELLAMPDIDGGLIGGASLDVEALVAIVRAAVRAAA